MKLPVQHSAVVVDFSRQLGVMTGGSGKDKSKLNTNLQLIIDL